MKIIQRINLLFILVLCLSTSFGAGSYIKEGEYKDAKFYIVVPDNWNKNVLLIAHGLVPEKNPLNATFDTNYPVYQKLVQDGWMIAKSSYRRNGMVIKEAAEDIDNLWEMINDQYGKPEKVYVEGVSMGGKIITLLAETRSSTMYAGYLGIGAALSADEAKSPYTFTYKPKAPLLFLCNSNEMDEPKAYAEKSKDSPFPAAVWSVAREGHANINLIEYGIAFRGLLDYSEGKKIDLAKDITSKVERASSKSILKDGGAYCRILDIDSTYGNILIDVTPKDFETLNISKGDSITLTFKKKDQKVHLGAQYSDVKVGQWVAFFTAGEYLKIAINMGNAAKALGCQVNETVFVKK